MWICSFWIEAPKEELTQVTAAALELLHTWKAFGLLRYVGVTTHNRQVARELLTNQSCDVLMYRYNMAHRHGEVEVFLLHSRPTFQL